MLFVGPWWTGWTFFLPTPKWNPETDLAARRVCVRGEKTRVGAATVSIADIAAGRPSAGYLAKSFVASERVAGPISVKAVVLSSATEHQAIVTADLLLINRAVVDGVMKALGPKWRREEIFFSATHTHSGPGGYAHEAAEVLVLGRRDREFTLALCSRIAEAINKAETSGRPSEWAHVAVEVDPKLIRNRTRESGPTNRWLDLLLFRASEDLRPIATVAIFGAHATCSPARDRQLSGDYPAAFCQTIERKFGGACLFLAGGVGSMAPPYDPVPRNELAAWYADQLAGEAARSMPQARFESLDGWVSIGGPVPLPFPVVRLARNWSLSPLVGWAVAPNQAWFQCLRLGQLVLIGTPADYGGMLAAELRQSTPGQTTVITSFSGDYAGYILPDGDYDLPKYEPRHFALYGANAEEYFQSICRALAKAAGPGPK